MLGKHMYIKCTMGSNPIFSANYMVSMVLVVSTSDCGSDRMGSNPIRHPFTAYGEIWLSRHPDKVVFLVQVQVSRQNKGIVQW